jgi:hypothetical protein
VTVAAKTPTSRIDSVTINRAPVLTLWAAIVAERLGYARAEALTLGKSMAGLNAQSKGRALGIYSGRAGARRKKGELKPGETLAVPLLGREIPAVRTTDGVRAVHGGKPIDPKSVERYLESKFKDALGAAREVMESLAGALDPPELAAAAMALYEEFRPAIPRGKRGWGIAGVLDLERVRSLAVKRQAR